MKGPLTLTRRCGRTYARVDGQAETPVRIAWARPLSGWGQDLVLVDEKKREVAMVRDMAELDEPSRAVVAADLAERYIVSTVRKVHATKTHFGVRYWDVETDRGRRRFAVKDPSQSVLHLTEDRMMVRDTLGNSFAIESFAALDKRSRQLVENVL
jgi:hypothetical protein